MEGLSSICAGLGILEEDDNGNPISYSKGEYCLGIARSNIFNFFLKNKCLPEVNILCLYIILL